MLNISEITILDKVDQKKYRSFQRTKLARANRMFKRLIEENEGRFRIALSISGTVIEQMERYRPDVLESFQELVASGGVELLAETYYHSLAFVHSNKEFDRQVEMHLQKLEDVFSVRPRVFRNTELIYNDAIAAKSETMGFDGVIAEGVEWNLNGLSPNFLYRAPETARIKTLLRNSTLSDDLSFRFSDPTWSEYPLTPEKFARWLAEADGDAKRSPGRLALPVATGATTLVCRHGSRAFGLEMCTSMIGPANADSASWRLQA
mgnify:CR=1 FL=1